MSKIEVNTVDVQCGSTLTLGSSGKTVTLASGASQTGFGRTGTVDWVTTVQTSTPFTAVSGKGYFINTTSGAITMNLPSSPSAGDIVAIKDYAGTFASNNLTIGRGGSNMNGDATDSVRNTNNESLTLVYADATQGWLAVEEGTGFVGEAYVVASGGTETTSGNCKIHTFTGPGSFVVCSVATTAANNVVSYMVIAGGGGGGGDYGAGAGAGGFREVKTPVTPYTASPLDGYPSAPNRITVTAQTYPIVVGAGGSKGVRDTVGSSGSNSSFSTITSAGGGKGGMQACSPNSQNGCNGGSGGGARYGPSTVGSGNTPPTTPSQGNNGGAGHPTNAGGHSAGGGGGAGAVGQSAPACNDAGDGGNGVTTSISATPTAYAGGGGGAGGGAPFPQPYTAGTGGTGGGGAGAPDAPPYPASKGVAGTANTGGGGGGGNLANPTSCGGAGGSGVVIIRYKYQ
jgi:hypothetical protein